MNIFQYKYYLIILLTVVATFNFLDRGVIALAMEQIKQEFSLSDSQLGLMTGFAFSLFYAIAGIPIARWADSGNRNHIVSLTTGLWSVMVAVSGLVGSFTQLLLVRVAVAVGESGCLPPAQSLIADYFDRVERPRAMAIYWMSGPLATVLAYLGGGWLVETFGWRITFIIIGIPGLLLALVVKFTLKEPRFDLEVQKKLECFTLKRDVFSDALPLQIVIKALWKKPAFRHSLIGFALSSRGMKLRELTFHSLNLICCLIIFVSIQLMYKKS